MSEKYHSERDRLKELRARRSRDDGYLSPGKPLNPSSRRTSEFGDFEDARSVTPSHATEAEIVVRRNAAGKLYDVATGRFVKSEYSKDAGLGGPQNTKVEAAVESSEDTKIRQAFTLILL